MNKGNASVLLVVVVALAVGLVLGGLLFAKKAGNLGALSGPEIYIPVVFKDTVTHSGATTLSGTNTVSGALNVSGKTTHTATTTMTGYNLILNSTSTGLIMRNAANGSCYLLTISSVGPITFATATAPCS